MTQRTEQLLKMASDAPTASEGEKQIAGILHSLRSLDREEIRYRFAKEEIVELVEYVLFEEEVTVQ
jgi:hypothetical protein